jgi:hypothetical protein
MSTTLLTTFPPDFFLEEEQQSSPRAGYAETPMREFFRCQRSPHGPVSSHQAGTEPTSWYTLRAQGRGVGLHQGSDLVATLRYETQPPWGWRYSILPTEAELARELELQHVFDLREGEQ